MGFETKNARNSGRFFGDFWGGFWSALVFVAVDKSGGGHGFATGGD